jgi:protein MpaA
VKRPRVTARLAAAIVVVAAAAGLVAIIHSAETESRHRVAADYDKRAATAASSVRRAMTIGYSVEHRRITAVFVGNPHAARTVMVFGCIHGNEQAGIGIAQRLAAHTSPGVALWIVPVLNPDGVAADTRQNSRGVDLNRNFPYRWRALGNPGYLQYSGPHPLSEPEARAAAKLILRVRPQITIWFHQPLGLVDLSGGDATVERRFARLARLPTRRLTRYPGSAAGWENHRLPGTTAFVVELPPGPLSRAHTTQYVAAVTHLAARPRSPTGPGPPRRQAPAPAGLMP